MVKIANKTGITSNTKIFGCKKIFYFFLINYLQLPKPLLHLHTLTVRGKKTSLTITKMNLAQVLQLLEAKNAELEITKIDSDTTLYEVIAPDGYFWNSGDCLIMSVYRTHSKQTLKEVYAEITERVSWGLELEKDPTLIP